ncbi:hypothetical protein GEV49_29465 [Streptomyces sp. SYP-A7193]|nr:hypothetical protein GEV49_29465 [Streptomyces sp. SYP-A7193]
MAPGLGGGVPAAEVAVPTGVGLIQPVRRLRTRPVQGRSGGLGAQPPGTGKGRGGGGENPPRPSPPVTSRTPP